MRKAARGSKVHEKHLGLSHCLCSHWNTLMLSLRVLDREFSDDLDMVDTLSMSNWALLEYTPIVPWPFTLAPSLSGLYMDPTLQGSSFYVRGRLCCQGCHGLQCFIDLGARVYAYRLFIFHCCVSVSVSVAMDMCIRYDSNGEHYAA